MTSATEVVAKAELVNQPSQNIFPKSAVWKSIDWPTGNFSLGFMEIIKSIMECKEAVQCSFFSVPCMVFKYIATVLNWEWHFKRRHFGATVSANPTVLKNKIVQRISEADNSLCSLVIQEY